MHREAAPDTPTVPAEGRLRRVLHRFVPAHFHDPVGLARRLRRSGNPAAMFAMRAAGYGLLLTPLDLLLAPLDKLRSSRATPPRLPIILLCGAPRSGTTLTAQLLIHNLPVAFFNNLTSVFPRAPLTAVSTFGRLMGREEVSYHSYYGRTTRWSGPNDGLYLWDRWLGGDRTRIPASLTPAAEQAMVRFFGAFERMTGRPLVAKNNSLNACASLVAAALPTSRFICLERSRTANAISLLRARREIHGREDIPYGLVRPGTVPLADPVEDVCSQVLFHEELAQQQLARLGPERFWRVRFEEVCRDPRAFLARVSEELLGQPLDPDRPDRSLGPIATGARGPVDAQLVRRIDETFEWLAPDIAG